MGALEHIGLVILAALMAAACDGGVTAPTTIAPATPTTPAAPTTPATSTTPATTSATTPPTSSTASTAMPTTTTPDAGVIGAVCASLGSGRWDERRDSIAAHEPAYAAAGGAAPLVDAVRTTCPDALARTEAAIDLAARMAIASQVLTEQEWVDLPLCADEIVTVEIRNPTAEPIGVVVATGADEQAPRYDAVVVEWSLAPGSSRLVTLPNPGSIDCFVWTFPFGADPSAVDGAVPGADGPLTTGDDPARWLPELLFGIPGSWSTGAETLAGRYDSTDLRDIGLDDAELAPATADLHPLLSVDVCPGSVTGPDADHVTLVYHVELGPATVDDGSGPQEHPGVAHLSQGVYRRGSDGRWRSLGPLIPLTGIATGAGCGPVVPHP